MPQLTELERLLHSVLNRVRAGLFSPELTRDANFVFNHAEFFQRAGDELRFIRAHSLQWEVCDQEGAYEIALRILQPMAKQLLEYLKTGEPSEFRVSSTLEDKLASKRKLARQKVMCCLGYGFALYRVRDYKEAERAFRICSNFLAKVLIVSQGSSPFYCWGTLARLHYFFGHLHRVQGEFISARLEFVEALDCAYKRLEQKKLTTDSQSSEGLRVHEQFANHCAGKVLGFGLGWTALLQGKLSNASEQLQAARVVLNDSHDEYLKWQVEMLSCAVISAQNGASTKSEDLLQRIDHCCQRLEKHKEYYWQSQNEFAKTSVHVARANPERRQQLLRKARERVQQFLEIGQKDNSVIAHVLLSRIASAQTDDQGTVEPEEFARKAYDLALGNASPKPVLALAAIALGEVLGRSKALEKRTQAVLLLETALRLSNDNLVARMAAYLHLAEIYLSFGDLFKATRSFEQWTEHASQIEHGWLIQKAESLKKKLDDRKMFVVGFADTDTYEELQDRLRRFLFNREVLKQKQKNPTADFDPNEAALNLRVSPKTIIDWRDRFSE